MLWLKSEIYSQKVDNEIIGLDTFSLIPIFRTIDVRVASWEPGMFKNAFFEVLVIEKYVVN